MIIKILKYLSTSLVILTLLSGLNYASYAEQKVKSQKNAKPTIQLKNKISLNDKKPLAKKLPQPKNKLHVKKSPTKELIRDVNIVKTPKDAISDTFALIEKEKFSKAYEKSNQINNPALKEYITYKKFQSLQANELEYTELHNFINKHSHWPGSSLLKSKLEKIMLDKKMIKPATEWFKTHRPLSKAGYKLRALLHSGNNLKEHTTEIKEGWIYGDFTDIEAKDYLKKFGAALSELDHVKKIDHHLINGEVTAALRLFELINKKHANSFKAQIALLQKHRNALKLFEQVPANFHTPGLIYHYLNYQKKERLPIEKITNLLKTAAKNKLYGDNFFPVITYITREFIQDKKFANAYKVISMHFSVSPSNVADSEFLAGWLALRFLNNPEIAMKHFSKFMNVVKTPISRARGLYWQGMSAAALNNIESANYYFNEAASTYPYTYYGQLAALKLNKTTLKMPDNIKLPEASLMQKDMMLDVALLIAKYGKPAEVRHFLKHVALNTKDQTKIFKFAAALNKLGNIHYSSWFAKMATQKHIFIKNLVAPTPFKLNKLPIEQALTYAIIKQESVFELGAYSSAKAKGLMQLIDSTACESATKIKMKCVTSRLTRDAEYNITLGTNYLHNLLQKFKGSYILAIAAYNAGPIAGSWMDIHGDPRTFTDIDKVVDWIELIAYGETRTYVQRVLENVQLYRSILNKNSSLLLGEDLIMLKGANAHNKNKVIDMANSDNEVGLKVGDKAPDAIIKIGNKKSIKLSDLKGKKVVLYFYPKDDTPGCTIEARDFSELKGEFEKKNAIVIGVSKDSALSHEKFIKRHNLTIELASDEECDICKKFGTYAQKSMFGKKYMGITRSTFLIDEKGVIEYIWPNVSVSNHASEVLGKIK